MTPRLLKAPATHGKVLAVPAFDEVPSLVDSNCKSLNTRFGVLRRLARSDLSISDDGPIIVTGHQPELFHPGVWVKNFAANGTASKLHGHAVNMIVDTDTVKSTAIRLPNLDPRDTLGTLPFDTFIAESPYETRMIDDVALFESFGRRLSKATADWPFRPVGSTLPSLPKSEGSNTPLGQRLSAMRLSVERSWGCDNIELAVSTMSRFESFREFTTLIINDADRFRESYNRAIRDYRTANKLKSRNHPAPELEPGELPFWTMSDGTRQRTFHVDDISKLRPKALILTLFARLILGDFFIHGLGGGKYDVVTDSIIRDFFGIEPPAYQILTATLHLPFVTNPLRTQLLTGVKRIERDMFWNPQRHLLQQSEHAVTRHQSIIEMPQLTRDERRTRFRLFRELAEELRPGVGDNIEALKRGEHLIETTLHQQAILTRRDYSWVLYPESMLKPFLTSFL